MAMFENKMFVVVGVIALIFAGITAYLVYLDRKLNRIRKQMDEINKSKSG